MRTCCCQFFSTNGFYEKFITWYDIEFSCTITIIIFSENSYRKHSNKNNLSLDFSKCNGITNFILWKCEEKCKDGEQKVFKCNNECSCSNYKKVYSCTRFGGKYDSYRNNNWDNTNDIYYLTFSIVFEIVFCMFWIRGLIVLWIYWSLDSFLNFSRYKLNKYRCQNNNNWKRFFLNPRKKWINKFNHVKCICK